MENIRGNNRRRLLREVNVRRSRSRSPLRMLGCYSNTEMEMRDREVAVRLQDEVNRTNGAVAEATMTSEEIEAILGHGSPEVVVLSESNSNVSRLRRIPIQPVRSRQLNRNTDRYERDLIVDELSDSSNAITNTIYSSDDSSEESIIDHEDNDHEDLDPANNTYERDSFVVSDEDISENYGESDEDVEDFDSDDGSVLMINPNNGSSASAIPLNTGANELYSDEDDDTVIRSADFGHCTICFEDMPYDPVGCLYCQQLIGCRKCINRWYAAANRHASLNVNCSLPNNHRQCPLCRHDWTGQVEVTSMFHLRD